VTFLPITPPEHGTFVLVQKGSIAKKESYCCMEPQKMTTQNNEKQKKKIKFLISTILCFPDLS